MKAATGFWEKKTPSESVQMDCSSTTWILADVYAGAEVKGVSRIYSNKTRHTLFHMTPLYSNILVVVVGVVNNGHCMTCIIHCVLNYTTRI